MLNRKQQAALNALTGTTLLLEMAEQDARDIECDTLSRTLPRTAQAFRRKVCRAALTVQEHLHARARARVLRLDVPTGRSYRTFDNSGNEYKSFLYQDFTLSPEVHRLARAAEPEAVDVNTANRRATLKDAGDLLAPHGLGLCRTADAESRAVLLDERKRFSASGQVRNDGQGDLITAEGAVALTSTRFDALTCDTEVLCKPNAGARARGGEFRPA
jgi:hypothetical protein